MHHALPLPSASETCRGIQKKSVWDFYLSKISAAPHAGNRRDVNSKATCGIAVVSFLISPLLLWRRGRQCDQYVFSEWSAGMSEITVETDNKCCCFSFFFLRVGVLNLTHFRSLSNSQNSGESDSPSQSQWDTQGL